MTEQEWLACTNPDQMLDFLHRKKSLRKQRLFRCACVRLIWAHVPVDWRKAIEMNEQYADGIVSKDELLASVKTAASMSSFIPNAEQAAHFACDVVHSSDLYTRCAAYNAARMIDEVVVQEAALLRDIFHPFGRLKLADPSWLAWNEGTIKAMASAIYQERAFDRLPILADALEEAGCTDPAILMHCRGPGPHVRGCFVVDLLLNKK